MESELAKSIVTDDHLKETPTEDKYGRYELKWDYATNGQIMVTITLAEYRELLIKHADDKVSESNSRRFTVERERDELKKKVECLQKELDSLKSMIAAAVPVTTMPLSSGTMPQSSVTVTCKNDE